VDAVKIAVIAAFTLLGFFITIICIVILDGLISMWWDEQHISRVTLAFMMTLYLIVNMWGSIIIVKLNALKNMRADDIAKN